MERGSAMALSMASRLSLDRGYVSKPSGLMNSVFISAATTASRMLVAAASTVMDAGSGAGQRWKPMDHIRYLVMLTIWVQVWALSLLMDFFPGSCSRRLGVRAISFDGVHGPPMSSALVFYGGAETGHGVTSSTTSIGRVLSHILGILNEIPVTSRKYEYTLAMADKILNDNVQYGDAALIHVNCAVLSAAFSRTCDLLRRALQNPYGSPSAAAAWPSRILQLLPLGPRLAACYDGLRICVTSLLPSVDVTHASKSHQNQLVVSGRGSGSAEWLEAEKLAQELLWIVSKMQACSAVGEGIARWGYASELASLALTAQPRAQAAMVKTTAVLIRELAKGEWEVPGQARFGLLALWLPLLCYASNGVTSPVLVGKERWEVERALEDLIADLPWEDQEVILANWIEDFAATDSDWPNLQRCFDRWCRSSRKLLLCEDKDHDRTPYLCA